MSISSSICADYANKRKEIWVEKFRNAFRQTPDQGDVIFEFLNIVEEMEDFEFAE